MARIVWSEPAIADLNAVADFIALENPAAASALVRRIHAHVGQLAEFPLSGSRPQELEQQTRYRQIIEPPCRIFYRVQAETVMILHVFRSERLLRPQMLETKASPRST